MSMLFFWMQHHSKYFGKVPTLLNNPMYNILENTESSYTESNYSVLSTENSTKTHLFSRFLPNKTIQEIPCPNLANLIENQWDAAIADAISIIKNAQYPTIILGCTHYPLILKELQEHIYTNIYQSSIISKNSNRTNAAI